MRVFILQFLAAAVAVLGAVAAPVGGPVIVVRGDGKLEGVRIQYSSAGEQRATNALLDSRKERKGKPEEVPAGGSLVISFTGKTAQAAASRNFTVTVRDAQGKELAKVKGKTDEGMPADLEKPETGPYTGAISIDLKTMGDMPWKILVEDAGLKKSGEYDLRWELEK